MSDPTNDENVEPEVVPAPELEAVEPTAEAIEDGVTDENAESPVPTPDLEDLADAPSAAAEAELEDEAEDHLAEVAAQSAEADAEAAADEVPEDAEISAPAVIAPSQPRRGAAQTTRRRDRKRDPNAPKPVVRAQAKYVRSSARKARLVCDNFRGKSVEEARAILAVTPRHVARDWSKLLESAVANAEHNHELVGEDLVIKSVQADEGPTIKRFRPRAQGRATSIRKRTTHLTILLTPKD
jgi:ribosomal protein L22